MPAREEYWRNPGKHRAATRAYAEAHPDWHRKSNREWAAKKRATPEGKAKENAAQAKYRATMSPERRAARTQQAREWRAKNPDYAKAWQQTKRAEDPFRYIIRPLLSMAKRRATAKGFPFSLTKDDITIPECCPVLGIPLCADSRGKGAKDDSPTLDRIIPERGYVPGNVRVISHRANRLKADATVTELEAVLDYLKRGW